MERKTRIILALVVGLISMFVSIYYTISPFIPLVSSFMIGLLIGAFLYVAIFRMTGKEFWEIQKIRGGRRKREEQERERKKLMQEEERIKEIGRQQGKDEFQRQKRRQREDFMGGL